MFTKHCLNKIQNLPPSPFLNFPFLGHLYLLKKPLHRKLSKISAKHGPLLLLNFGSRRVLLISSPSAAEECFTKNDVVFANRPHLLAGKHLGYNYTSLTWASYGDHWRNLRRMATVEVFAAHRLQSSQVIRVEETRILLDRLFRASRSYESISRSSKENIVDMKSTFFEMMLNVLMRMIAGKRYYGDNDVADEVEARRFKEIVSETFVISGASNLGDFLPVMKLIEKRGIEKKMMVLRKKRDQFVQELIDEHRRNMDYSDSTNSGGGSGRKSMIELLLSLQQTEPEYYNDEIIRGLILVRFF